MTQKKATHKKNSNSNNITSVDLSCIGCVERIKECYSSQNTPSTNIVSSTKMATTLGNNLSNISNNTGNSNIKGKNPNNINSLLIKSVNNNTNVLLNYKPEISVCEIQKSSSKEISVKEDFEETNLNVNLNIDKIKGVQPIIMDQVINNPKKTESLAIKVFKEANMNQTKLTTSNQNKVTNSEKNNNNFNNASNLDINN